MSRPLVLVSQRRDVLMDRGESRDGLDDRWPRLLWALGFTAVPVPNDRSIAAELMGLLQPAAVLLTGGNDVRRASPGHVRERNESETLLLQGAKRQGLPALGVCRGFQMMNTYLGGGLAEHDGHVRVRHEWPVGVASTLGWCNSFHELAISGDVLAKGFDAGLTCPDGTVEFAFCLELRWTGVMWHPERENGSEQAQASLVRAALQGDRWVP